MTDVNEIVHKFLTREQTYSQLLQAVSENEAKIDHLRKENEELYEVQIDAEQVLKNCSDPQVQHIDESIKVLRKDLEREQVKQKQHKLIKDQVTTWAKRVIQKIDQTVSA